SSVPMPRGKTPDEVEAPAVPEVVFPAEGDATYAQDGRDPFLPPRDWNPLPYLTLPWPPLPEIGAIESVPAPGMELAHLSPLRREPPGESLTGGAPSANGGLAAGGDDISSGDQRFAGIDFGDAAPRAGSGPVVDVERT